jgi:hypothetical protein
MAANTSLRLKHVLFVGPLLIYIGLARPESRYFYWLLAALGVFLACAFAYAAFTTEWSQRHVWFGIHAVLFSTLLLYAGYHGPAAPDVTFNLLLAVGIAALGYHGVKLVT